MVKLRVSNQLVETTDKNEEKPTLRCSFLSAPSPTPLQSSPCKGRAPKPLGRARLPCSAGSAPSSRFPRGSSLQINMQQDFVNLFHSVLWAFHLIPFPSFLSWDNTTFASATTLAVHSKWCRKLLCSFDDDPALLLSSYSLVHPLRLILNWSHIFCPEITVFASQRSVVRVRLLVYVKCFKIPSQNMLDLKKKINTTSLLYNSYRNAQHKTKSSGIYPKLLHSPMLLQNPPVEGA